MNQIWTTLSLLILSSAGYAQVNMTVQLTPPYDVPLLDIQEQITVMVSAPAGTSGELRMSFVRTNDEGVIVRTRPGNGINVSTRGEVITLAGSDLDNLFSTRLLEFVGVGANEAMSEEGLPPGPYSLCFYLISGRGGTLGNGCTDFNVPEPTIAINTQVTPPYNVPFDEFSEQASTTITASRSINGAQLQLLLTGNGIRIATSGRGIPVSLDKNEPLTLNGSDIESLLQSANLSYQGISPGEANGNGLPPGDYELCFSLTNTGITDRTPPTGCANFTIAPPVISINTTITPPVDKPFNELSEQLRVTVNSPISIDDGFFNMRLQGDNGVEISTKRGREDYLQINGNEPFIASGGDLDFHLTAANLDFTGISSTEANENGLPPGNYDICFRLWYDENEPATDASDGCTSFTIDRGVVSLTTTVAPPYDGPLDEFADQATVTVNSTQAIDDGYLQMRLTDDNGIQISSKPGFKDFLVIDKNTPTTLTGTDLSALFQSSNLNYQGTTASEVNENGLPPGSYELCFRLFYPDNEAATDFACSNFRIDRGVVTLNTRITPPYDMPLADLADQVTVSLNSTKNIDNAFLRLLITGNNGVKISSKPSQKELFDVNGNDPLTHTGSDLNFHFNSANLNFQGISAQDANAQGLPPGEYELCFQLWYADNDPATGEPPAGCTPPFNIDRGTVTMVPVVTPPYDIPFDDFGEQTSLTITASRAVEGAFLRIQLTGDNGLQISSKTISKEFIDLEENEPLAFSGSDLSYLYATNNLNYQGISANEANESGLPFGDYELCFRLWYDENDPATDEGSGCAMFNIGQGVVTLNTIFTPPYNVPLLEMADQTTVNINTTQAISDGFLRLSITGDNGVEITSKPAQKSQIDIQKNQPLSLSGSDLDFHFTSGNLNFTGITAVEVNESGLPPGNYELCFRLWYNDDEPATGEPPVGCSAPFNIGEGLITINTVVTPPYQIPLDELLDQTTVSVSSTSAIDDGFLTMDLSGDNGIRISNSAEAVKELLQVAPNEPLVLNPNDLIALTGSTFEGISAADVLEQGLPAGNYELCFRLWYDENEPATDEGLGCAMFGIGDGVVTINTLITPPYEVPFADLADQLTVNLISTQRLDKVYLTLLLEEADANFSIRSEVANVNDRFVSLQSNELLALSGTDLIYLFEPSRLLYQGIEPNAVSDGLPSGEYNLCFQLWDENGEPITDASAGCANFTISPAIISLNTVITPPYNQPFSDLSAQVTVTLNANRSLNDVFLRLRLTGDNGVQITTPVGANELFDVEGNVPLTLSGSDFDFLFNTANLSLQGVTASQLNDFGLTPGLYDMCFQLWYNDSEPATDEMQGCYQFMEEPSTFTLAVQVIPPYTPLVEDMASMTNLTLVASADMPVMLKMRLIGDNDVVIANSESFIATEPIALEANTPLMLSDFDLNDYFTANALTTSGIAIGEVLDNGLPEGNYQVCFTAFTPNGTPFDVPEACSNMFPVNIVEPPQVMTPECGAVVSASEAQQLMFNWIPSVGAPPDAEYTLKIVELLNPNQNPNDAILSSTTPSFLEETMIGTSFFYGPAQPILEPGRTYAYQVFVSEDISRGNYVNRGGSPVCHFTIADEQELTDTDDEPLPTRANVPVTTITKNPYPGYFFPVSQVTGTLKYKFKHAYTSGDVNSQSSGGQVSSSSIQNATSTFGSNQNSSSEGQNLNTSGFSQAQSSSVLSNQGSGNLEYILKPEYNQDNISPLGAKPLANVKVSLLQTYVFYGKLNGENVYGKTIEDGDITQGENEFKTQVAPDWGKVVATTTTDHQGNFSFNVLQYDSLGEALEVDWTSTSGDIQASWVDMNGHMYKVYRLIVESPYYCSPDMNIMVQPWEGVELGTLVSFVRSYKLRVFTKRVDNNFYDYSSSNSSLLTDLPTKIIRKKPAPEVPIDEGQFEYGSNLPVANKLVSEGRTNAEGYIEFGNLVRHNVNNTLDQYHVICSSNDFDGNYAFKEATEPYPVFPYNADWDWKENEIGTTFHLPTSQNVEYDVVTIFNSQFEEETYVTTVEMHPQLPRVFGQITSKQVEVTPQSDEPVVNTGAGNQTAEFASQNESVFGQSNDQRSASTTGFNLSTNSSSVTLAQAFGNLNLGKIPNWSTNTNSTVMPNVPVNLVSVGVKDNSFNNKLIIPTDANGWYKFEHLPIEFNLDALQNSNENDGANWTQVIGPSRALIINATGYEKGGAELGILRWGDQVRRDFELEPDGYVYGYVEDELGHPVKAEVFVDSLVSTTTVMSAEYQQILGIPMPLKEVFVLKAPSGSNRQLHIVPDNLVYVPGSFSVNIEKNTDQYEPQNLGGFEVETYKHRIRLQVVEQTPEGAAVNKSFPIKNALVRVTNVLNDSPTENTETSGNATPSTGGSIGQASSVQPTSRANQAQNGQVQSPVLTPAVSSSSAVQNLATTEWYYGYTDQDGYVELVFENNAHHFDIEVLPALDLDFVPKTITVYSESSGETVDHGQVVLEPAFRIAGKVSFSPDSSVLENARVLIDQGGENLETRTDAQGNYILRGIPMDQNQWTVSAENVDHPLTLIADTKTINTPFPKTVNFHLSVFDEFTVKELIGLPVTVSAIEEVNGEWQVTGAFINLPANPNFSVQDEETRLKFYQVAVAPQTINGEAAAVPVADAIATESDRLDLINYTSFIAHQKPIEDNLLQIKADNQGKGYLAGAVDVQSSSFQFEENYMSFNQPNSPDDGNKLNTDVGMSTKDSKEEESTNVWDNTKSTMVVTDKAGKSYIQLFSEGNNSFRLYDQGSGSMSVTTLKAGEHPVQPFGVTNAQGEDYAFKVQDFRAVARKQDSYVFQDSLTLATTLSTNNIPKMVPEQLQIDVGNLRITSQGYENIYGSEPLKFKLEEWEVVCEDWEMSQYSTGIKAAKGKVITSLFQTAIKDIKITPDDFDLGAVDLNNVTFGGIIPVKLETQNLAFEVNPACTYDNEPHWMMRVTGSEGQAGASVSQLPGMKAEDKILIESFTLYSNGEKELNVGDQSQDLLLYDVVYVTPTGFNVMDGGVQMSALMDLKIPKLKKGNGSFRYIEKDEKTEDLFLGMNVDFEAQGKVEFFGGQGTDEDPAQILTQGNFDARGTIVDAEGIYLLGRLHKDKDSTYVVVEPLHQQLAIADDGSNKLIEITGDMEVVGDDWEYFTFSGDLYGMKGVQDSQKRKTFTVYGSINAEGEGMDVKNINADFAGIEMTYDIKHARLTGELEFEQNFSSVYIAGKANLLVDRDGWYFMASGAMEVPGFGNLKAGLGIGDYARMAPDMKTTLLANAYDKTIPSSFQNGFSGFFFTGRKNFPQFSIPKTEFNFIIIKGSLYGETGLDARLWMGFDDSGAEFGIGVMAYAQVGVSLTGALTCTSVYGYIAAELGVKGMYNTGNSTFSLQGCGAIILAGKVEQCFGGLGLCCWDCCVSTSGSTALRVDMLIDSSGNFDASLGIGSCSGNVPSMAGNW